VNIERLIVQLAATNKTPELIGLLRKYDYDIDINSPINFRGDTLLHYACFKNNLALVKFLIARQDTLRTVKNLSNKTPKQLTTNSEIQKLVS
jgi:ankyrin repeat protein